MIFRDFIYGLRYGIPLCCIIRYCFDELMGRPPAKYRNSKHNLHMQFDDVDGGYLRYKYVPCMIFHKGIIVEIIPKYDSIDVKNHTQWYYLAHPITITRELIEESLKEAENQ